MTLFRRALAASVVFGLGLAVALGASPAGAVAPTHPAGEGSGSTVPLLDPPPFTWNLTDSGSTAGFRGLDAVSAKVAWATSDSGDVLRTTDGGAHWNQVAPPDSAGLLFRDVEATTADRALILSIGAGGKSRIYRTTDGGSTWDLAFRSQDKAAFFDGMAMFDGRTGVAMSDPVDGKFRIIRTTDGGASWSIVDPAGMPAALDGEAGFAASGTSITARANGQAWFATGGGAQARVFHTADGGLTWTVASTPIRSTEAGGIFSVAFRSNNKGLAVGGDFTTPDQAIKAMARTKDGGLTWKLVRKAVAPTGYRSGSAWLPGLDKTAIVVGPTGSDVTIDGGRTWQKFDDGAYNSVDCSSDGACWASGPTGRLAFLSVG